MNQKCHGTMITTGFDEERYYRCGRDGSVMKTRWFGDGLVDGAVCPNCERVIDAEAAVDTESFGRFRVLNLSGGGAIIVHG